MEPAKKAIAGIDSAIAAAPDAAKYVPDQLAAVQTKLADLKTAFDNKDYATVLTGAPAVLTDAQGLLGAAMLKKEEVIKAMSREWPALAASLPGLMTTVTNRSTLGKSKKGPAGWTWRPRRVPRRCHRIVDQGPGGQHGGRRGSGRRQRARGQGQVGSGCGGHEDDA